MALFRRTASGLLFVTMFAIQFGLSICAVRVSMAAEDEQPAVASEITAEQWMSEWMSAAKPVSGALHMSRFKDPMYFLTKPISWKPAPGYESLPQVEVPKGFVTDLASIPRLFWSLLRPDGEYTYPAIIHDYLYWIQPIKREKADLVFRLAMEDFRIDAATAFVIYNAVRLGGGPAWQSNADQRARGERRILKRFPEDPRVNWDEWKKEPDVFAAEPVTTPPAADR
jgi:hypothetical protein